MFWYFEMEKKCGNCKYYSDHKIEYEGLYDGKCTPLIAFPFWNVMCWQSVKETDGQNCECYEEKESA